MRILVDDKGNSNIFRFKCRNCGAVWEEEKENLKLKDGTYENVFGYAGESTKQKNYSYAIMSCPCCSYPMNISCGFNFNIMNG